jgi:hypothetical protein
MSEGRLEKFRAACLIAVLTVSLLAFAIQPATAASVTSASDILSRSKNSTLADHEIKFVTPTGLTAGQTITLTFHASFTMGSFALLNFDFATGSSNNCTSATFTEQTLDTTPSGATWGIAQSGQVVTLTSGTGTVTADRCVRFKIGANATQGGAGSTQITNPSSSGTYTVAIAGTFTDTGTIALHIIDEDQIQVTGTVDTTIACTVNSAATRTFGTFVVNTVTSANSTIVWTVSTNAANGYSLTVRDQGDGTNGGLYSAGALYNIRSADASGNATANLASVGVGYGLQGAKTDGDAGSATTTLDAAYDLASDNVGRLNRTASTLASATGPVASATVTSTLKAKISGLVPAGSYADTLTYICTAVY